MKTSYKLLIIILVLHIGIPGGFGESKPKINSDTMRVELINKQNPFPGPSQTDQQKEINDLNKQIVELTKIVAETKLNFYDSSLKLWNFILAAIGLSLGILGYIGFRGLTNRLADIKKETEKSIEKSEQSIKDIKSDLIKRIDDIKIELKDFKKEQKETFDKFEKDARERIKQGLDTELTGAVDKIMKGSFEEYIDEINDQITKLSQRIDLLVPDRGIVKDQKPGETVATAPITIEPKTNAFDDEHNK